MTMDSTKSAIGSAEGEHFLCDDWFDPLETGVRTRIRSFIEELLEAELDAALGRDRYERPRMGSDNAPKGVTGLASRSSGTRSAGNVRGDDRSRAPGSACDP